ncbi:MAG: hypothetical protein KatS3mg025_0160 [Bacteroidia bacterium]|nr:MAG: hypothetical protein KatS3mg025_0160 [Bacteroidia bacterium]
MRVNGLSYWGHWLILAGGLIFFIVLGKVLPPGWERIELPEQVDTFALPIPAWEGEPLRAQVPPPARPSVRKDKVASQTDTLPGGGCPGTHPPHRGFHDRMVAASLGPLVP